MDTNERIEELLLKSLPEMTDKELLDWIVWAEKEISEYQQFISTLRDEVEKRK